MRAASGRRVYRGFLELRVSWAHLALAVVRGLPGLLAQRDQVRLEPRGQAESLAVLVRLAFRGQPASVLRGRQERVVALARPGIRAQQGRVRLARRELQAQVVTPVLRAVGPQVLRASKGLPDRAGASGAQREQRASGLLVLRARQASGRRGQPAFPAGPGPQVQVALLGKAGLAQRVLPAA